MKQNREQKQQLQEVLTFVKEEYEQEIQRFSRVDNKALSYITIASIISGFELVFFERISSPGSFFNGFWGALSILLALISIVLLLGAIMCALISHGIYSLYGRNEPNELAQLVYTGKVDLVRLQKELINTTIIAINGYSKLNETKGKWLKVSRIMLFLGLGSCFASIIIIGMIIVAYYTSL